MTNDGTNKKLGSLTRWAIGLLNIPLAGSLLDLWKVIRKALRGFTNEGIYEVINLESTLELKDKRGEKAIFRKRERVRYLQDQIIAYQDQAWSDGEFLIDYRCTPGIPVDSYRAGYKTLILISLRGVKNKGNVDEFNIEWGIQNGFLLPTGFWATEISHRTKKVKVQIIFPKSRPPVRISLIEKNHQRTRDLGKESLIKLPDGRWKVAWEKKNPILYEQYVLNWEW